MKTVDFVKLDSSAFSFKEMSIKAFLKVGYPI